MELVDIFPNSTSEENNAFMFEQVSLAELKAGIHTMKVDKRPEPDIFLVEFYIGFLDILESDILIVADESRVRGKIH